jgi:Cdc6-like AAA superfamily ATPase
MGMSPLEKDELKFALSQHFKPTMPINREDLFSGRRPQTEEVVEAINQNGQHVVLYGERGVGKTSLANMIMFKLRCSDRHIMTPHINCSSVHTYSDLWASVLDDIKFRAEKSNLQLPRQVTKLLRDSDKGLPTTVTPEIARRLLTTLSETMALVVIIDEFDMIKDVQLRQQVAETIKYFSDRNVPATIVLVGVADDISTLLDDHESIGRCIAQVRMPRMSRDEVEAIIVASLKKSGMTVEKSALHELSRIAQGLPHYAHLMGLHAGRQAVENGSKAVNQTHVAEAIHVAIERVQFTVRNAYLKGTTSAKKNALYKEVLLACSLTESDDFGYFAPADVRPPLERVLKRPYQVEAFARHLHTFCEEQHGPVLKKSDLTTRPRFRFADALMQPFVLMKGLDDKMITEDDLSETRNPDDPQGRLF